MKRSSEGKPEFQDIYTAFTEKVFRYLARLVGEAESEDLTHEVFIKAAKALENFRGDSRCLLGYTKSRPILQLKLPRCSEKAQQQRWTSFHQVSAKMNLLIPSYRERDADVADYKSDLETTLR